jgi:hypothetical protein
VAADAFQESLSALKEMLVAVGAVMGIEKWVELTDTWTKMTDQVARVSKGVADLASKQKGLMDIAMQLHAPIDDVSRSFVNLTLAMKNYGMGSGEAAKLILNLGLAARQEGKEFTDLEPSIARIATSMNSGNLSTRQFVAINNALPQTMKAVAQSLGFDGTDGVKKMDAAMIAAGKAGGGAAALKDFLAALTVQAGITGEKSKSMAVTIGEAMGDLGKKIQEYYGQADQANGMSALLASTIEKVAKNFKPFGDGITIVTAFIASYGVAMALAFSTSTKFFGLLSANPFALIIGLLGAATAAVLLYGDKWVVGTDAMGKAVTAVQALKAAFATLVTAAQDIYKAIMSLNIVQPVAGWFKSLYDAMVGSPAVMRGVAVAAEVLGAALSAWLAISLTKWLFGLGAGLVNTAIIMGATALEASLTAIAFGVGLVAGIAGVIAVAGALIIVWDVLSGNWRRINDDLDNMVTKIKDNAVATFGLLETQVHKVTDVISNDFQKALKDADTSAQKTGEGFTQAADKVNQGTISITNGVTGMTREIHVGAEGAVEDYGRMGDAANQWAGQTSTAAGSAAGSMNSAASSIDSSASKISSAMSKAHGGGGGGGSGGGGGGGSGNGSNGSNSFGGYTGMSADGGNSPSTYRPLGAGNYNPLGGPGSNYGDGTGSGIGGPPKGGPAPPTTTASPWANGPLDGSSPPPLGWPDYGPPGSVNIPGNNPWSGPPNDNSILGGASGNDSTSASTFFDGGGGTGAFATGGSFLVSGGGGTDSQVVKFRATPGELVTVMTPDQQITSLKGGTMATAADYGKMISSAEAPQLLPGNQTTTMPGNWPTNPISGGGMSLPGTGIDPGSLQQQMQDRWNTYGQYQPWAGAGSGGSGNAGPVIVQMSVTGATNPDSFRRSESQTTAKLKNMLAR